MARVAVLGASGSGKSYYTGFLLEQRVPEFDIAVHFDPEDEEKGLSDVNADPLYETLPVDGERYAGIDWVRCLFNHRRVRVIPEGLTKAETADLFGRICAAVMALCKDLDESIDGAPESALVSCDEAHTVLVKGDFDERVERLITGGRKHGVESIFISQRPQLLPLTVLSQADRRVYFRISQDRDLDKIQKVSNFDAGRLDDLPSRRCIVENKDSGAWKEMDTDGIGRRRPHYSGDDGLLDDALPV